MPERIRAARGCALGVVLGALAWLLLAVLAWWGRP
jgi:hypothetical protein